MRIAKFYHRDEYYGSQEAFLLVIGNIGCYILHSGGSLGWVIEKNIVLLPQLKHEELIFHELEVDCEPSEPWTHFWEGKKYYDIWEFKYLKKLPRILPGYDSGLLYTKKQALKEGVKELREYLKEQAM